MTNVLSLHGAGVVAHDNGDISITGTEPSFITRSLVRGKGKRDDWAKAQFN